jgi:hypothetical protein
LFCVISDGICACSGGDDGGDDCGDDGGDDGGGMNEQTHYSLLLLFLNTSKN